MKITSVKIFGQKYKIIYNHDDEDSYGETNGGTNTITIRPSLPEDKMIRVLMHEVTHAVIFETPLAERKRFGVEEVCDIVGNHIVDTLKDNPALIAWIQKEIADESPVSKNE